MLSLGNLKKVSQPHDLPAEAVSVAEVKEEITILKKEVMLSLDKLKAVMQSRDLPAQSMSVAEMKEEITILKNSRDHLKDEVIRLKDQMENLQRKLDTTFQFFEIRIDQIYRSLLETDMIDHDASELASELQLPTNPEWEKLIFAAKSPYIEPGPIPSPITLSGMRIDTRYAVEKLHYTFIKGGVSGIAVFGPYRQLLPGSYVLELALEPAESAKRLALRLEVFTTLGGQETTIAECTINAAHKTRLAFEWNVTFAKCEVEFRIHQLGGGAVRLYGLHLSRA
jgi:uncharacterized small protein (DUF1192 family)